MRIFCAPLVGSQFDDANGVVNGLDGSPEIKSADNGESTPGCARASAELMASKMVSSCRRTFAGVKGTELDRKLVGPRSDHQQFFCRA